MLGGIYASLSGLAAAQNNIVTAAHNTANANTEGFKRQRVTFEEVDPLGVESRIETVDTPGPIVFQESDNGLIATEQSNVDLGDEAINLILGQRLYEANLRALDIQNQVLGNVLDINE